MKQLTKYNRVAGYLNHIFELLNETYFENTLSKPVITIQSTPRAYGHVSVSKVWNAKEDQQRELNIAAGTLDRPIEETVATMLHEMVHLYCLENEIQDTSRGCTYHNKKFKAEAEKRDLHIEHHEKYGWTITTPTEALFNWCCDNDLQDIYIKRFDGIGIAPIGGSGSAGAHAPAPKKSSTRKYKCPCCGSSVRATKEVRIMCADCNEMMIEA